MTSIEEVIATGILQAYITGGNHVVVVPTFFSISVWMNQGMSSIWSKTLSEIVNEIDR